MMLRVTIVTENEQTLLSQKLREIYSKLEKMVKL